MSAGDRRSLWTGGGVLFASMTIVNLANYAFNLILGRWLGPAPYADLALIATITLVLVFMTTTLQMVGAKYFAGGDGLAAAPLRRWMSGWAWAAGLGLGAAFVVGAPALATFFNMASPWPFRLLGAGLPFYVAQAVERGALQGSLRFGALATTYQVETWVRLLGGLAAVAIGWGVNGAVGAISLSFVATWLTARVAVGRLPEGPALTAEARRRITAFAGAVVVTLIGEIVFSHSDILVVKRFFPATEAGWYAALAIIGRVVFYAPWAIIATMFPIVAGRHDRGESHRHLLLGSVGLVLTMAATITTITALAPEFVMGLLFGDAYLDVAPLLWRYALATSFFTLGNVIVHYQLSIDRTFGSWLTMAASVALPVTLWVVHDTLEVVVNVQIWLMGAFLAVTVAWMVVSGRAESLDVDEIPIDHIADR